MYNTVLEERISALKLLGLRGINDLNSYLLELETFSNKHVEYDLYNEERMAIEQHAKNNYKHYVLAKDFYSIMSSSCKNLKLDNMPSGLCFNDENRCYQVTIPNRDDKFIIYFHGKKDLFNIFVYQFKNPVKCLVKNENDMNFWILKGGDNITCQDMLDIFYRDAVVVGKDSNKKILMNDLSDIFNELVNIMLYINSGKPDLREYLPRKIKSSIISRSIKNKDNFQKTPYTVVGFSFKKEIYVNPFFRWQPYGPNNSLRRYQLIDGYPRNKRD